MDQRYRRYTCACQLELSHQQLHTDYCLAQLQKSNQWAAQNRVWMATEIEGEVQQANGQIYLVNLEHRICSCGHFQSNGIPCGHAFSVIGQQPNQSPKDYVPFFFLVQTWKETYTSNISPISLDDVSTLLNPVIEENQEQEVEVDILPQIVPPMKERSQTGRPQIQRRQPGGQRTRVARAQALLNGTAEPPQQGKGSQACRRCGTYGHNWKTCIVELNF